MPAVFSLHLRKWHYAWMGINWLVIGQVLCVCATSATPPSPGSCCVCAWVSAVCGSGCYQSQRRQWENIPPATCWLSKWDILEPDRPSVSVAEADDCSESPPLWFGSGKHRISPAAWCRDHSSLNTGKGSREEGSGCCGQKKTFLAKSSSWLRVDTNSTYSYRNYISIKSAN